MISFEQKQIQFIILAIAAHVYFCVIYFGSWHWHVMPVITMPQSALDSAIPLLPFTVIIYLSQYLLLMTALFISNSAHRKTIFYGMLLSLTLAGIIFLLFPTTLPKPTINSASHTILFWQFLLATDVNGNCFPSLHVALALWAAKSFYWEKNRIGVVWAYAVILSTLTTKQHIIVDVLAGMSLFYFSQWIIKFTEFRKVTE